MDVSKLTAQDAEKLAEMKRTKAPLGVIHPVHTTVRRPPSSKVPDLTITAAQVQPGPKPQGRGKLPEHLIHCDVLSSPKRPPEGQLAPKNFMPGFQRPKTAKQQKIIQNVTEQILSALPLQVKKIAVHRKLTVLTKKDTRQSTEEYLSKVRRNLNKKTVKRRLREDVKQEGGQVMAKLDEAFTRLEITETQYNAARKELEMLVDTIESQLWKEKTLSRFMHKTQVGEVTLQKLKRHFNSQQVEREGLLISMQRFVHALKVWKEQTTDVTKGMVFSVTDLEKYLEENLYKLGPEDRTGISYFLERMHKHLQRLSIIKPVESLPLSGLERIVEDCFVKWDGERVMLEGVFRDIETALEQEEKIRDEVKMNKGGKELELKIIAEFVNQYFDKLEESIIRKKEAIENLLERIHKGTDKPQLWVEMMKNMRESIENEELERELEALNEEAEIIQHPGKKRHKSPLTRPKTATDRVKSNIGKHAVRFTEEKKAKEEEKKEKVNSKTLEKDYSGSISLKNPLEMTNLSAGSEQDDVIGLLNAPVTVNRENPTNSGKFQRLDSAPLSVSTLKPEETVTPKPILDRTSTLPAEETKGTSFLSTLMKKPTEEDKKSAELRALKEMSPFQSLEMHIPKHRPRSPVDFPSKIAEIEHKRGTHRGKQIAEKAVETDKNRSQLIASGEREFSVYLDEKGEAYDPEERFRQERESMKNHIDPRYVEEMMRRTPGPDGTWYVRPHHLKSVTYHPYSIDDNPTAVHYQSTFDPPTSNPLPAAPTDQRSTAVGYLERTVEDLKCELEERRRRTEAERVPMTGSYLGWVGRAVETVNP